MFQEINVKSMKTTASTTSALQIRHASTESRLTVVIGEE